VSRPLLALHTETTLTSDLPTDAAVARETGWDGLEVMAAKLRRYLDAGGDVSELVAQFDGVAPLSLLNLPDVERQAPAARTGLLQECEDLCALANSVGCSWIQLLTGPLDPRGTYSGLTGADWESVRTLTARNIRDICDLGARHGISFYLEGLAWTPVRTLEQLVEIITEVDRSNLGIVVDFWHLWTAGTTADDIARLDGSVIACVHFCDALDEPGGGGDPRQAGRNVWPGNGLIPLREWVDAIRSTGFDGWWSCELLGPLFWEMEPEALARAARAQLAETLELSA